MATVECPSCRTSNPSEALYCSSCGAATHHADGDDLIGMTVGGRYHLVEKIGQGSAGILYRAEHVTLRRRMAVKLLHKQLALSEEAIERFRREAITVCEIDNDHIPQVHDFGRTEDDQLFFAMEFLDGETLSSVLEREGRVSAERTADVLTQIADGLMEAHTLGYVHRDLRPRSIFLTRRRGRQDFVKILDFGLAKLVQPEVDAQRTAMGMTYGDPRYMAPEQARGETADRRADIYSLGVLGFEMLVGEPPFKGGGTFEVLQKVLDAPVPRIRDRRTDCPPWLESVVRTALAKRPSERFQTVAQLLDALERKQVLASQPPMPVQLTSQQASKLAGAKEGTPSPSRPGGPPMQVFVSSPSLRVTPLAVEKAAPGAGATQAMPTVAQGNRAVAQGGASPSPAAVAASPAAQAAAPRMTLSYPTSKLARSATLPGVYDAKPSAKPEPRPATGAANPNSSGELRLLNERLPPVVAKSVPAVQAAAVARPVARAAEAASRPGLLIAPTTPPRADPTPRTARAMLEQEVMAWEEAAMPVLSTADLTDSTKMRDSGGRAASADTPVEAMKFAAGATSEQSPPAEPGSPLLRPISAPVIAAMRSFAPGSSAPKGGEPVKAPPAAVATPASPEPSSTTPAKQAALGSAAASKSSDRVPASSPGVAARDVSGRQAVPIARLAAPVVATAAEPAISGKVAANAATPVASGAEHAPFGVGGSAQADDADEDSADATIPHIRVADRDDATPTIGAGAASTRSPAAAATDTKAPAAVVGAQEAETRVVPKTTAEQPVTTATDTAPDAGSPARATGAESSWFATPAASAGDSFATDDHDVSIGRRPLPKWAMPAAAAGLLLLGIIYFASRPSPHSQNPNPPVVTSAPSTSSAGDTVAAPATPTPPPPVAPSPPSVAVEPAGPPSEPARTEPIAAKPGPEVTPLPVATAIPGSGAEKPAPTKPPEVTPTPAPEITPLPAKSIARSADEPKTKPTGEPRAPKTKPDKTAKAEPERKTPVKQAETAKPEDVGTSPDKADKPERKPGDATALIKSGRKKLEDGEPEAAVALFNRAVELDPRSPEAVGGLGEASFEQGNFEVAAKNLNKAAKLAPKRTLYQELLVQALYKVGRFKDAAEACRKLLKQDPGSAKAKQTLELAEKKLGTASDN